MYRSRCRETLIFLLIAALCIGMICSGGVTAKDSTGPRVVQVYPSDGMEYVPVDTSIHIVFSEPMDEDSTISAISISPAPDFSARSWQFLHDNSVLVVTPSRPLKYSTTYTVTITRDATSSDNIELRDDYRWTFTTVESPASPVELPRNGGFQEGDITSWTWSHTEERGARAAQWKVVSDGDSEHVLAVSRPPTFEMGSCSLEQAINAEVPLTGLVFLSLDVLISDYTLKQYDPGDTYPLKVIVDYVDRDGKDRSFERAFYYHMPVDGGIARNAEFVELGKWTNRSYNLSAEVYRPSYIKSIKLEFSGWSWLCMVDNIRFVW